jgi:hypothetical protein
MQKTLLRPGTPKPRLSDLLHRRSQTIAQYTSELGISHDVALEMHCVMHGIVKDVSLPASVKDVIVVQAPAGTREEDLFEPVEEVEKRKKKKPVKNALVDLTDLVHGGKPGTDTSDEG